LFVLLLEGKVKNPSSENQKNPFGGNHLKKTFWYMMAYGKHMESPSPQESDFLRKARKQVPSR